jgi:hypothetical protein
MGKRMDPLSLSPVDAPERRKKKSVLGTAVAAVVRTGDAAGSVVAAARVDTD